MSSTWRFWDLNFSQALISWIHELGDFLKACKITWNPFYVYVSSITSHYNTRCNIYHSALRPPWGKGYCTFSRFPKLKSRNLVFLGSISVLKLFNETVYNLLWKLTITMTNHTLFHVPREFYFVKLIIVEIYTLYFHIWGESLYSQSELRTVELFSHVEV